DRDRQQPRQVFGAVLEDPVVVDLGAGVAQRSVGDAGNPQAPGRVQDFCGDVVCRHQLHSVHRIGPRLGEILEAAIFRVGIDQLVHARGFPVAADEEKGAFFALEVANGARHGISEAVTKRLFPQVARFEDVRIGGDDELFHRTTTGGTIQKLDERYTALVYMTTKQSADSPRDEAISAPYHVSTVSFLEAEVTTAADRIFEQTASEILQGALRPGDQISERYLVTRFGVSRTPVREAIKRLFARGLVESGPKRVAVVPEIDGEPIHKLSPIHLMTHCSPPR